jgi:hypothetical protein
VTKFFQQTSADNGYTMQQIQREFAGLEMDPDRLLRIIEPMAQKGVRDSSRYYRKFSIDYPQHIEKVSTVILRIM